MTHSTLYPASVEVNYQSAYGIHTMTFPTAEIEGTGDEAVFVDDGIPMTDTVGEVIETFIGVIKGGFPASTTFINWIAYTYATVEAVGVPVATGTLGIAGTNPAGAGTWSKATQQTFTFKADDFSIFKLVWLDCVVGTFDKTVNPADGSVSGTLDAVFAEPMFLRSRRGGKPLTFLQASRTLNEKLRKAYRMD